MDYAIVVMNNSLLKKLYYLVLPFLLLSCQDDLVNTGVPEGEVELSQINAVIASSGDDAKTRTDVIYLEDHISRFKFVDNDQITFTSIRRSLGAIPRFNYSDITFQNNESGAWDRDKNTGSDAENGDSHPVRIYWSDATSKHTFIGYSLPNVKKLLNDESAVFDWTIEGNTYYGSIGVSGGTGLINYNPTTDEKDSIKVVENKIEKTKYIPKSSLMCAEDLLLAYDTAIVAEASVANIKFYHGLSSIKVKVMLSDFYGSELDGYTIVDSMVVKNQPTLYRWEQTSYKAAAKSNIHSENNPRDMFLWDYVPAGVGENAGKTFTFYGITVPQESGYQMQDLILDFRVKYPDPLKTDLAELKKNGTQPGYWLEKKYQASIAAGTPVYFHPNQCTIINIKLNHKDETMTIGAQYTDWEFVPTPDEGSLKKNSTFLQSAPTFDQRPTSGYVTIATDPIATEDDATWLYYKKEPDGSFSSGTDDGRVLLDIYGNTGTIDKPYTISTANQLLSFAYEVSNGGVRGTGNSFEGKYIKLDAGIILQKNPDSQNVTWFGIGTAGTPGKPFQGTFLGAERKISLLKGAPLFNYVGEKGLIDKVIIENPLTGSPTITSDNTTTPNPNYRKLLTGNAALAEANAGVICACIVNGDVGSTSTSPVGSLVGTNSGTVFACHHTGAVSGEGSVCGLVGSNSGSILFSYHAGELVGSNKYGVSNGGTITDCYYDSRLAPSVTSVNGATGKSTVEMQKISFVNDVYSAAEADDVNATHLIADENGVEPGQEGYIPTYSTGYTPLEEGDPKPSSNSSSTLNGQINNWVNDSQNNHPLKSHFASHQYLYQPAAYPKIQ